MESVISSSTRQPTAWRRDHVRRSVSFHQRIIRPSVRRCAPILAAVTLVLALRAAGQTPPAALPDLAARLSDAATAMEYWDVTGQFRSGHRLFARLLITNEGPGSHTGAAIGHLVHPTGAITLIKSGRTRDEWTVSPDRRRLKIGKSELDMSEERTAYDVDSNKHGIKIHIESARRGPPIALHEEPGVYSVEVITPAPAHGTFWLLGMDAPIAVEGTLALTHSWMERSEAEILLRHNEVIGASEDSGIYFSDIAFVDGRRRAALLMTRAGQPICRIEFPPLSWDSAPMLPGDARYPVAAVWESRTGDAQFTASLQREWLRWNPLDIVPVPFRWIFAMKTRPQRVWADAEISLTVAGHLNCPQVVTRTAGIAVVTFQQPVAER